MKRNRILKRIVWIFALILLILLINSTISTAASVKGCGENFNEEFVLTERCRRKN